MRDITRTPRPVARGGTEPAAPETGRARSKAGRGCRIRGEADQLRSLYEPYAVAIALNLSITLPPWIHPERQKDNWQAGPWDRAIQARGLAARVQSHG